MLCEWHTGADDACTERGKTAELHADPAFVVPWGTRVGNQECLAQSRPCSPVLAVDVGQRGLNHGACLHVRASHLLFRMFAVAILLAVWPVDPVVAALKALDRGC